MSTDSAEVFKSTGASLLLAKDHRLTRWREVCYERGRIRFH